jgi:hypothetical protein
MWSCCSPVCTDLTFTTAKAVASAGVTSQRQVQPDALDGFTGSRQAVAPDADHRGARPVYH